WTLRVPGFRRADRTTRSVADGTLGGKIVIPSVLPISPGVSDTYAPKSCAKTVRTLNLVERPKNRAGATRTRCGNDLQHDPKGRVMRKFAPVLVAGAWLDCGSQAHPQEPLLVPGPSSPVRVGQGSGRILLADINRDGHLDLVTQHLLSSRVALLSGDGKG